MSLPQLIGLVLAFVGFIILGFSNDVLSIVFNVSLIARARRLCGDFVKFKICLLNLSDVLIEVGHMCVKIHTYV